MTYRIAALYKFVALPDYPLLQVRLREAGEALGIRGTILLAEEGINGTIAGEPDALDAMLSAIRSDTRLSDIDVKFSESEDQPFLRFKVRLKKEIVTIGRAEVDPTTTVGTYVAPDQWNDVVADPNTVVIDTRNDYEVAIGTFEGALDPNTETFRDFPTWVEQNRAALEGKRIAMFCTGGIRCEKASSYMLSEGFDEVLHLKGGILKYLETQPEESSTWNGDCFVFDQRVAVSHGLAVADWDQCFACRRPISEDDKAADAYVPGVSCPHCIDTNMDRKRYAERQRQITLAKQRGEAHLGQTQTRSSAPPKSE